MQRGKHPREALGVELAVVKDLVDDPVLHRFLGGEDLVAVGIDPDLFR